MFAGLVGALLVLLLANLCLGSVPVPLREIGAILVGGRPGSTSAQVIWSIRLPRLVAAALLGGALALAGFLLQVFFHNPIAGPFVLGISHGAKLAVALTMIVIVGSFGVLTSWMSLVAATLGSLGVMAFVLGVSRRTTAPGMLVIAGVMVGYLCSAATDLLVSFANDANIVNLRNWSLGSFSGTNWSQVALMTGIVVPASACVLGMAKALSAYQLGESYARSVGVDIESFRRRVIVLSSILSACVTAFAGPISFVGIAVPHIVKRLLGTSRPLVVIPATFLGGSVFCLGCDMVARCAFAPTEVAVSTITALFGAPVVIWVMLDRQGSAGMS